MDTNQLTLLITLQQRALQAQDHAALGFIAVNDTWQLLPYDQASLFLVDELGQLTLRTVSSMAKVEGDTPFSVWAERVLRHMSAQHPDPLPYRWTVNDLPDDLASSWHEWWPEHALCVPLAAPVSDKSSDVKAVGVMVLVRATPWADEDLECLSMLSKVWATVVEARRPRRRPLYQHWHALKQHPRRHWAWVAIGVICLLPVRMSALAPAEIIPLTAEAVSAPMDGVIKTIHVPPNQAVKQGQVLFSLDDTAMRNRRDIASQGLAVARADALAAQQKSFENTQSKADLAALIGRMKEKEAELAYLEESLARTDITAAHDGILVYGDANDWQGRPVVTGERVAQLADPVGLGVLIWLSIGDAINLEPGARIRVFLQVAPLRALDAELIQTSYQATPSPEGVTAYRIRGRLLSDEDARIGLRGVAKVYGQWRPLAYWVMRRPLGTLRQWVGL